MEYVYAALLLHSAGKEITEENLKKVLEAAGVQVDEGRIKSFVEAIKEVNIDEVTNQPIALGAPAGAAPAETPKEEEKKEEEEEKKEEEAVEGLAGLFG